MTKAENPLAKLLQKFIGWTVVIPNVEVLSPSWALDKNPHRDSVREEYNTWVQHWYKDAKLQRKIAALDAHGFTAMCWPRAGRVELLTLSKLLAWYFPWDDVIDEAALSHDRVDPIRFEDETIEVVKESLLSDLDEPSRIYSAPVIQSFWDIGAAIRAKGSAESNQRFAHEHILFIRSATEFQGLRETSSPVKVAEYLRRREYNIGARGLFELMYYAHGTEIPSQWQWENNIQMKEIWKEMTWMVVLTNDLFSLRKELEHGQYDNIVPLLMYHEGLNPQAAVDRVVAMLREGYERARRLEEQLYAMVSLADLPAVKAYVHDCKNVVTANLHWSHGLKRYMEKVTMRDDGTVSFEIQTPLG